MLSLFHYYFAVLIKIRFERLYQYYLHWLTMASSPTFEIENDIDETRRSLGKLSDSTASLSTSDSNSDLSSRIEDFELSLLRTNSDDLYSTSHTESSNAQQQRKKSVRFSQVHTREYNVIDELPSPLDHEDETPRRTLGWDYSESQTDIEAHAQQVMVQKKEKYARLIHEHILRAEKERENKNKDAKLKKNGWKARVKRALKPVGQSFMEAAMRTNYLMA